MASGYTPGMALSDEQSLRFKLQLAARLAQMGDRTGAVSALMDAQELEIDDAAALTDCGMMLADLGEIEAAGNSYRRALVIDPDHAEAHNNLANIFRNAGRLEEAVRQYRTGIAANGMLPALHYNLGVALRDLGELAAARTALKSALRLSPELAEGWSSLGNVEALAGDNDKARQYYENSLELSPRDGLRLRAAMLLPAIPYSEIAARETRQKFRDDIAGLTAAGLTIDDPLSEVGTTPFYLAYQGENDRADLEALAALYRKSAPALNYTAAHCEQYGGPADYHIHIGFLSAHFRNHTLGRLMEGVIRLLPRDRFMVHVYTQAPDEDEIATAIRNSAESYVVLPKNLAAARDRISEDRLDVLVHAGVGLDPFNYFLAFARLAPVQCVSWGHPVTGGIDTLNYYLSSVYAEIDNPTDHYSESLMRFAYYATCFRRPVMPEGDWTRDHFGLPEGEGALYLCPQSLFKFGAGFDDQIGGILRGDPDGHFILIEGQRPEHTRLIRERFARSFPDVLDRVIFLPRQPTLEFYGLMSLADAIIDTPQFSGGVTSLEALSFGIPVVTLPSAYRRGRLTYAQYKEIGVEDLIAGTEDEFVALAVRLGTEPDFNEAMRIKIGERSGALFENQAVIDEHATFFQKAVRRARVRI